MQEPISFHPWSLLIPSSSLQPRVIPLPERRRPSSGGKAGCLPPAIGDVVKPELTSAEDYTSERARFDKFEVVDIGAVEQEVLGRYKNQVVLDANGECLRLSVFEGEYRWHFHPDTDELFLVVAGELHIEFEDRAECVLHEWQCLCVPAGAVHRTRAVGRTVNLTFEKQNAKTLFVDR